MDAAARPHTPAAPAAANLVLTPLQRFRERHLLRGAVAQAKVRHNFSRACKLACSQTQRQQGLGTPP